MTLNEIADLVIAQAQEKGWGHTKDMLVVSEKMMLIATEVTEMREAIKRTTLNPKDTLESECSDVLLRTTHLGKAWGVDFDKVIKYRPHTWRITQRNVISNADLVYFYTLITKGYDYYRHKNIRLFKKYLYIIAREIVALGISLKIDIQQAVMNKVEINKNRIWSSKQLNGTYYKK